MEDIAMKKKIYEKPTMTVVELQHRTCLLQASGEQQPESDEQQPDAVPNYNGVLGYAPGNGKDGNHSA
jgi:hypothetical protein